VLVPDPDAPGRIARIRRAVADRLVALGPSGECVTAPRSWSRARGAVALVRDGVLPARGLIIAAELLGALAIHADPALVAELAQRRLEPLRALTAAGRARLEATLLAWLRGQGNVAFVAAELHVHPQTVRYRLARLREHFGVALDDPDVRFELELALRARGTARA